MIAKKVMLLAFMLTGSCIASYAQYDDDIYYNPSKDKKAQVTSVKKSQPQQSYSGYNTASQYNPNLGGADYASADSYSVAGTSDRDVDEYNRRGSYSAADTLNSTASGQGDDFKYTRRIEKYYNEDIIADVNDPELVEYYYSTQPDVTINIVAPGYGWFSPWYWNDPWYWNAWGPYWSWGWGPSWSWGWGPAWSWSWGWDPFWSWGWGYPGWGPGWGGGGVAWRPTDYAPNGRRAGQGIRNGYTGIAHNSRPGLNNGRVNGLAQGAAGNFRPGSSSLSRNPQSGVSSSSQGTTGNRTTGNRNSYNNSNSNRSQNSSFNNNSSSSRSYSSPSRSSGSSRGGFGGSSGGGSHRGGRR